MLVVSVYLVRCWISSCRARSAQYEEAAKAAQRVQTVLKNSPKINYNKKASRYKQSDCPICLYPFEEQSQVRMLECDHVYHEDCIVEWVKCKEKTTCPICNIELTVKHGTMNNWDKAAVENISEDWQHVS